LSQANGQVIPWAQLPKTKIFVLRGKAEHYSAEGKLSVIGTMCRFPGLLTGDLLVPHGLILVSRRKSKRLIEELEREYTTDWLGNWGLSLSLVCILVRLSNIQILVFSKAPFFPP